MMAFWLGLPPWVRTAAMWTGAIILAVITGKLIIAKHDERIIKEERLRADLEAVRVEAAVVKQIQENSDDLLRESDAVRSHDAASVLPDGRATLPDYHFRD
jgi:type II secretory pathway component PulM